eukprot:Lithocolla_globosa_v1_NODE_334_length_4414_cov_8.104841.p1 type:complete len:1035 gc:universal NODE_334_length_4414_cov_8.104841:3719-615(-)
MALTGALAAVVQPTDEEEDDEYLMDVLNMSEEDGVENAVWQPDSSSKPPEPVEKAEKTEKETENDLVQQPFELTGSSLDGNLPTPSEVKGLLSDRKYPLEEKERSQEIELTSEKGEKEVNPYKVRVHAFMELQQTSASKIYAFISLFVIVLSTTQLAVESLPVFLISDGVDPENSLEILWFVLETFFFAFFTIELSLRFWSTPLTWREFWFNFLNIIDFVSCAVYIFDVLAFTINSATTLDFLIVLRLFRLFRILRVVKVARFSGSLQMVGRALVRSTDAFFLLLFMVVLIMVMSSSLIYYAERGEFNAQSKLWYDQTGSATEFQTIFHSFWWAIATVSTVGYGDVSPVTGMGKFIASGVMMSSIMVIALPTAILGTNFLTEWQSDRREQMMTTLDQAKDRETGYETAAQKMTKLTLANEVMAEAISSAIDSLSEIQPPNYRKGYLLYKEKFKNIKKELKKKQEFVDRASLINEQYKETHQELSRSKQRIMLLTSELADLAKDFNRMRKELVTCEQNLGVANRERHSAILKAEVLQEKLDELQGKASEKAEPPPFSMVQENMCRGPLKRKLGNKLWKTCIYEIRDLHLLEFELGSTEEDEPNQALDLEGAQVSDAGTLFGQNFKGLIIKLRGGDSTSLACDSSSELASWLEYLGIASQKISDQTKLELERKRRMEMFDNTSDTSELLLRADIFDASQTQLDAVASAICRLMIPVGQSPNAVVVVETKHDRVIQYNEVAKRLFELKSTVFPLIQLLKDEENHSHLRKIILAAETSGADVVSVTVRLTEKKTEQMDTRVAPFPVRGYVVLSFQLEDARELEEKDRDTKEEKPGTLTFPQSINRDYVEEGIEETKEKLIYLMKSMKEIEEKWVVMGKFREKMDQFDQRIEGFSGTVLNKLQETVGSIDQTNEILKSSFQEQQVMFKSLELNQQQHHTHHITEPPPPPPPQQQQQPEKEQQQQQQQEEESHEEEEEQQQPQPAKPQTTEERKSKKIVESELWKKMAKRKEITDRSAGLITDKTNLLSEEESGLEDEDV